VYVTALEWLQKAREVADAMFLSEINRLDVIESLLDRWECTENWIHHPALSDARAIARVERLAYCSGRFWRSFILPVRDIAPYAGVKRY
jgi:hypothetical protein